MPVPEGYPHKLPFDNTVGQDAFRVVPDAPDLFDVDDDFKKLNCYNGNEMLMLKGTKFPYTAEHIAEWKRCKNDIYYFLMNYAKIISLDHGEIKFKLFQYQKNMIKMMQENRFSIHLLPRQMGKCYTKETMITVRNKNTGEIEEISIGDFIEAVKARKGA